MGISATPLTIKQANAFITAYHRHHKPVTGHRFSIGAVIDGQLVGVAVVGRPVARALDQYNVAEVTRLATDGSKNVCSFLYSRCAQAAKAMGFKRIHTYILDTENGASVKAANFKYEYTVSGRDWNTKARGNRRTDQPMCDKHCYAINFI